MLLTPDISGVSIVLVGSLNPLIFRPEWFGKHGLLLQAEADAADIEVIHREISLFRTGWFSLRVDSERLVARTNEPPFIRLSDLVARTFREFLSHTPLRMLGINRLVHFNVGSGDVREAMGMALAPREPWGQWGESISAGKGKKHGGMRSLTMEQRVLDDRPGGFVRAKIEPSVRIEGEGGVFTEINDHYEVVEPSDSLSADAITALLESNFEPSIERSEWIIDQIMALSRDVRTRL